MGVKGLQAYVDQCCPGALRFVKIKELAQQYRHQHGTQPVLVIDGMSLLRKFYNPSIPCVYGGEWLEFFERIRDFVEKLKEADIKPVFIFDGVVEQSKRATWLDRRKKERRLMVQVFEHIKRTGQHPDKNLYHIPPSISECMKQSLKYLGVEVIRSIVEADKEIFRYYKKHRCFGVLSQDSDFLIFDIDHYFSSISFDLNTLRIKMYNKEAICRHLGLRPSLLPLLACILGNDTISPGCLTKFHHWVTGTPRDKKLRYQTTVPCCAEYLASLEIQHLSEKAISDFENHIFHQSGMEGVMQQVVNDYTMLDDSQDVATKPHQPKTSSASHSSQEGGSVAAGGSDQYNHPQSWKGREMAQLKTAPLAKYHGILEVIKKKKSGNTGHIEQVLRMAETECNMSFEDDTNPDMPSAAVVLKPIRQRIYGVLFGIGSSQTEESEADGDVLEVGINAVHEYYAYAGNPLKDPDVVAALPLDLPGGTPTLEDLWVPPGDETLILRQQALMSCLHCKIDSNLLLETLPRHYVALCCLVHFFVQHGPKSMMRRCDVNAFVAEAVCLRLHTAKTIRDMRVSRVDPRGVHMATIFMRGLSTFRKANSVCAQPINREHMLPWQIFDGKLFHVKYLLAQNGADMRALCQQNDQAIEDFQLLRRCILTGTRLEKK